MPSDRATPPGPIISTETEQAASSLAFQRALPAGGIQAACRAATAAYRAVVELGADPGQAARAALLAASGEKRPYKTDLEACSCPWAWYHPGQPCKHTLALRLAEIVSRTDLLTTDTAHRGSNGPV